MRLMLLSLSLFYSGAVPALASSNEYCPSLPYQGAVKTVSFEEVRLDRRTGAVVGRHKKSDTEVSRDRRLVKTVTYEVDTPTEARLKMFPTTIFEYDEGGRLIRKTLKLDGTNDFTVSECHYDMQGRVSLVTMRSKNPEFDNRRISFAYGPNWETERFQTRVANNLTTRTIDGKGRVIKEVEMDELRGFQRGDRDIEYDGNRVTTCWRDPDNRRQCSVALRDDYGNEIERKSSAGASKVTYQYDGSGNWVSRRHDGTTSFGQQTMTSLELVERTITYWYKGVELGAQTRQRQLLIILRNELFGHVVG